MKGQPQTTPDTKNGIAKTYIEERERTKKILDKLEVFNENLSIEKMMAQDRANETGQAVQAVVIEAPEDVISHFNRGKLLDAFKKIGYFLYQGAIICQGDPEAPGKEKERIENILEDAHGMDTADYVKKYPQEKPKIMPRFKRATQPPA